MTRGASPVGSLERDLGVFLELVHDRVTVMRNVVFRLTGHDRQMRVRRERREEAGPERHIDHQEWPNVLCVGSKCGRLLTNSGRAVQEI